MKFSTGAVARIAVAAAGGLLLVGTAGTAFAAEVSGEDVDVNVDIAPVSGPGSLSMTVAGTLSVLAEVAAGDPQVRQFEGDLPTVTVTDTRDAADIPADRFWYVLGQASAFVGPNASSISPDHFGWTPRLVDGGETGLVSEGEPVDTSKDNGADAVGLVGQELLYTALDSAAVKEGGESSWTADAGLVLKTGADVTPGSYSSKLTLSLFEDAYTQP